MVQQLFPPNQRWLHNRLRHETAPELQDHKNQFAKPCDAQLTDSGNPAEWLGLRAEEAGALESNKHHWTMLTTSFHKHFPQMSSGWRYYPPTPRENEWLFKLFYQAIKMSCQLLRMWSHFFPLILAPFVTLNHKTKTIHRLFSVLL